MCRNQIRNRQQYSTMNPVIEQRQLKLFETLMEETSSMLNCEASQLLLIDPVQHKLKTKVAHKLPLREFELDEDVMGSVCTTAQLANVADFSRSKFFSSAKHANYLGSGIEVRTVLCVPVINTEHHVIGCLMVRGVSQSLAEHHQRAEFRPFIHAFFARISLRMMYDKFLGL